MSRFVIKLLTAQGPFYAAYETVVDQFVSCAYSAQIDAAQVIGEDLIGEEDFGFKNTIDLRPESINEFTRCLAKLKVGESLSESEACEMYRYERFFKGTIATHQYDYPELDAQIRAWAEELNLNKKFPDDDEWKLITDHGMFPVFQDLAHHVWDKMDRFADPPTPEQNKIVGRYLSKLALMAKIAGPDKDAPAEIVDKFYAISQTRQRRI